MTKIKNLKVTGIGRFFYYCLPYRKRVILSNISTVFGDSLSNDEKKHLTKAFYSHFAKCFFETILVRFLSEDALRARVTVKGHEHMLKTAAKGRGVLVLTGHFGSFEFAPLGGVLNFKAFQGQFHFIRRTLNNKWVERILFSRYRRMGLQVIPKHQALTKVQEALDNNHAVIFVLDQHASLKNRDGIAVPFFGKDAGTYRSLASFQRYTNIPVVPASSYRLPNGKHVLEFHPPLMWEETEKDALYHNTRRYNEMLEKMILEHPEQWMWFHKRWKPL